MLDYANLNTIQFGILFLTFYSVIRTRLLLFLLLFKIYLSNSVISLYLYFQCEGNQLVSFLKKRTAVVISFKNKRCKYFSCYWNAQICHKLTRYIYTCCYGYS